MEKREKLLAVRLSDKEKILIEKKANKEEVKVSDYIRNKILDEGISNQRMSIGIMCELSDIVNKGIEREYLTDQEMYELKEKVAMLWQSI